MSDFSIKTNTTQDTNINYYETQTFEPTVANGSIFSDENNTNYFNSDGNIFLNSISKNKLIAQESSAMDKSVQKIKNSILTNIYSDMHSSADTFEFYNGEIGFSLGYAANSVTNTKSTGMCLQGVVDILYNVFGNQGFIDIEHPWPKGEITSAYQARNALLGIEPEDSFYADVGEHFQEVDIPKDSLDDLPPGCIVIWNACDGHPHGHISISTGDGREASDFISSQTKDLNMHSDGWEDWEYTVFMPILPTDTIF